MLAPLLLRYFAVPNLFCTFADVKERAFIARSKSNLIPFFIMGKAQGLFGNFSGKVGNLVGFQLKNSATNQTQGVRAYQPTVSNPKTEPQAIQRMKMTAAVNFYRQLTEILNNAWQGQKYGTKSRNYFMKLAMSQAEGIPFVDKGDKHFYPGQYPVSQGSLPTQAITAISGGAATTTLSLGDGTLTGTWGELSQELVNNNFGILNGDKLTFIAVGQRNGEFAPIYSYVIVNTSSEDSVADVFGNSNIEPSDAGGYLAFAFSQFDTLAAAAIIISRYPVTSGGSWLRSSSTMFCSASYIAQYMGSERYAAAIATYQKSEGSASSDWYLNQGIVEGSYTPAGGDSNLSMVTWGSLLTDALSLTNDQGSQSSPQSATPPGVVVMSDGTGRALKTSQGNIAYFDDGVLGSAGDSSGNTFPANAANLAVLQAQFRTNYPVQYSTINITGYISPDVVALDQIPKLGNPRP